MAHWRSPFSQEESGADQLARDVQPVVEERKSSMKSLSSLLVALVLGGCLATSTEGTQTGTGESPLALGLPAVRPPLVAVQSGVSVLADVDVEVFYTEGYYWTRRDTRWFRAHDHRGGWAPMEPWQVPLTIVDSPPGRYLRHHGDASPQASAGARAADRD